MNESINQSINQSINVGFYCNPIGGLLRLAD